jgi:hypothetical protein
MGIACSMHTEISGHRWENNIKVDLVKKGYYKYYGHVLEPL